MLGFSRFVLLSLQLLFFFKVNRTRTVERQGQIYWTNFFFDLKQKMKEFLNSFEIFSGWGGGLVAWVVVGAVLSEFEIGELHDI